MTIDTIAAAQAAQVFVRRATLRDITTIQGIVDAYRFETSDGEARGKLIPLTEAQIGEVVAGGGFYVAEHQDELIACGSVVAYNGVIELRSLATRQGRQGLGAGRAIVDACVADARTRTHNGAPYQNLLTLTQEENIDFFRSAGFQLWSDHAAIETLDEKYMRDCAVCPVAEHCLEYALVMPL